jgi:hypothetical protein
MKFFKKLIAAGLVLASAGTALGAVTAEEAKKLGTTLTLFGAEMAGNKDGSIPAYTGGLTTPPANFKKGSGLRPDPFAAEKPLYSVNDKNMAQYADKLTDGTKALMKKYPSTYRIDVYKTHRTVAFPKHVLDNTAKNALRAKTANGGISISGAHGGYPFPIPKDGYETMWNALLHYGWVAIEAKYRCYTMDKTNTPTLQSEGNVWQEFPYYEADKPDTTNFYMLKLMFTNPARRAGEGILMIDPIDPTKSNRRAYQYLPGQRRVKLAPDLSYDAPNTSTGGVSTWDDLLLFSGAMDRYDFKLVGKREMLIPYNDYRMAYFSTAKELVKPNHMNPDVIRWELHRVWVVEANLKPGKRHIYKKRVFYLDEDSWGIAASDQYDARGQLYKAGFAYIAPSYDVLAPYIDVEGHYDLISGMYVLNAWTAEVGGYFYTKPLPAREWTGDALAGSGVR